jgi:pantoate--beta-alanine ligase
MRQWRDSRDQKTTVGFVPTMGALHQGHMSLVQRSMRENDLTIASIYVNPTQFGPTEDLTTYPRTEAADLALLQAEGAHGVFIPSGSLYETNSQIRIVWQGVESVLKES